MLIEPIGIIYTPFNTKDDCPIQPIYSKGTEGRVEIYEKYAPGLKDIESFSHIFLIYQFDRAGGVELIRPTFLDDDPHGIFASRHPCRPSGIGISVVKLMARDNNMLLVEGIDVLNNTPLLDIKPYIPKFDRIDDAVNGWVEGRGWRPKPEGRE